MIEQIQKNLPRSEWEKVSIAENTEPLVEIKESERLKVGFVQKEYKVSFFVRRAIAEKLEQVASFLPSELNLVLIEGYRSMQNQQESWDKMFFKLKTDNPTWLDEAIEAKVRLVIAKPNPLANHHCGGAVDVTLAYSNGELLDMGTPYPSEAMSVDWYKKFQMFSIEITEQQRANRKILRDAMETQGFVWYPGEWWHYCYGDRMWAVYTNQTECIYGPIELF